MTEPTPSPFRRSAPARRPAARIAAPAAALAAALGAALTTAAAGPALAQSTTRELSAAWRVSAEAGPPRAQAEGQRSSLALLEGWRTPDGGRMAGLTITLAPGWKTYWRVPGDAGIPPDFDWSGSENLERVEVRWPRPVAFDLFGMTTLGYKHAVTLPLAVTPRDPSRPVMLRLRFAYGVCSDICMPEMADLALLVPPTAAGPRARIEAALRDLPQTAAQAGARLTGCRIEGEGEARRLVAAVALPRPPAGPVHAIVEAPEPLWFEPGMAEPAPGGLAVSARLDPASGPGWLDRGAVRVTLLGADGAVVLQGCDR